MSIIQEALKKAQRIALSSRTATVSSPSPSEPAAARNRETPPALTSASVKRFLKRIPVPRVLGVNLYLLIALVLSAALTWKVFAIDKKREEEAKAGRKALTFKEMAAYQEVRFKPSPQAEKPPAISLIPFAKSPYPNLALNGIMFIESHPQAIINNTVVEVGDTIEGARVVRIERNAVVLSCDGGEVTLTLKK